MNVVLISTYELGRQPFGLASPATWLRDAGARVICQDLSVQELDEDAVAKADLVAFYVPMHTATRLAARAVERVKSLAPQAHLCFFGLYAAMNEGYLRKLGADTLLSGEFEEGLTSLVKRLSGNATGRGRQIEPGVSMDRLRFKVPDRSGLPLLDQYAKVHVGPGDLRTVGYTEASRGCKHLCRHCPVVPVYNGAFRVIQRDVVLEDVRRQRAAGAQHITFGDPDFFNGPTHAIKLVEALHREFPELTYDVTIKIEHLLQCSHHLETLRETGCLFVTSAVESVDDAIVKVFDKGHTREDFIRVVALLREADLILNPTFVAFNPWITAEKYAEFLELLMELDLVDHVSPIQYGIRLLIPEGSKLLELEEVQDLVDEFDEEALCYRWSHPDPRVDRLCETVLATVQEAQAEEASRREVFRRVWRLTRDACERDSRKELALDRLAQVPAPVEIPYLTEPWYC